MKIKKCLYLLIMCLGAVDGITAGLPVMNTLPRWNHGYGLQVNYEHKKRNQLYQKNNLLVNHSKFLEDVHELSLQGVFSFTKEYRLFFEIPWETQIRNKIGNKQRSSHIGEISFGGAFKKYYNATGQAGSFGLAPLFYWSNNTDLFRETNGGVSLSLLSDIETYHFLGIASLKSKMSFVGTPVAFLFEESLFLRGGYHVFHINANNTGGWLSLGIEGKYSHPSKNFNHSIFTYTGFAFDIVPNLMVYWNNYLLHTLIFIPIYRRSIGQHVTEKFRFQISFGGAFLY